MNEVISSGVCHSDYQAVDDVQLKKVKQEEQHILSPEDWSDAYLAHQYRLSLPSSPSQSNFRVLALLFYEELSDEDGASTSPGTSHLPPWIKQVVGDRTFIVGTNDEPGYMGGAICAERSAMVQMRFVPAFRITKLVIATDCETVPISPGMLCREFLAGHGNSVPWDLKVISTGSQCMRCKKKDEDIFRKLPIRMKTTETASDDEKSYSCIDGHEDHCLATLKTTIAELYPFPSPYTRLTAPQSVLLGRRYNVSSHRNHDMESLGASSKKLLELAILEAKQSVANEAERENHPIHFGAAVVFEDQSISTSHQSSALEYGCSLDAVSQLVPYILDVACNPVLFVQVDQYGVAHAPFAPARAFLSEHGYEYSHVLVHDTALDDVTSLDRWKLKEVTVSELAPTPPDGRPDEYDDLKNEGIG
eukprot:CAMPEP_0201126652 /NCGR_PEP_ID=MMETSP0850-20130426/26993_1 /ASSEMBLY_ACC=CAM_ASM_000622 /TAXON_ID=183588 /ORGANISM="Pseudo-nitzschia fraudulenta, Strain WWA7" /LENGTH=418 /DNA_ID=CAMNT_0047395171 /DNA_START=99 /DNA_END=1356 /DNA_ORIENTATION=+